MADIKWSAFPSVTSTSAGDSVVGLHSGANERFLVSSTPSASGIALWDANSNMSANNFLSGYATTATAAATTTLLVGSKRQQFFTGVTTQTVLMPVTSTLVLGQSFYIVNNSTGVVTVQSSGANTIKAMAAGSTLLVTCIAITGTTAASWNIQYAVNADLSGAVLLAPSGAQTITGFGLTAPSFSTANLTMGTTANTIASTNTNGNINIVPNGSGTTIISGVTAFTTALDLQIAGVGHNPDMALGAFANDSTHAGVYYTYKSRSAVIGAFVPVQSGDIVGFFTGRGDDGTTFQNVSAMQYNVDGAVSSGIVPGNIKFMTTNSSGTLTTALTLNSAQLATFSNNVNATVGQFSSGSSAGGVAGSFQAFATTAALGSTSLTAANNAGNFANVLTNASTAAARTWTLPDATGTIALGGSTIPSITGTANQVLVNGTSGSPVTGTAITLTTPQDIATTSIPTFQSLNIQGTSIQPSILQDSYSNGNAGFANIYNMRKSRGASIGSQVAVVSGDSIGAHQFYGSDGTDFLNAASIVGSVSGAVSTGIVPGQLVLRTTNTSGVLTTALTISNDQVVSLTNALLPASGGLGTGTAPSAGQIPIGNSGGTYTPAAINSGAGILVANGSGSITISATGGGIGWTPAASTPVTAAINTGYIVTDASQVTFTLPVTAAVGSVVRIAGNGAGGWILAPGSGQTIKVLAASASTSITSAEQYDCIEVVCTVANTTWVAISMVTTGFTIS